MSTTETTTQDRADAGAYHAALVEIAEIVKCGVVSPGELPGKVREMIEGLRADDALLRRELAERLTAEVARLTAENTELRRDVGLAEDANLDAEIRAEKAGA